MKNIIVLLSAAILFASGLHAGITVTEPTSSTVWLMGCPGKVCWSWSNLPEAETLRVRVILQKDGGNFCPIAENVPLTQGQFQWTVGAAACPGLAAGTYRVRIRIVGADGFNGPEFAIKEAIAGQKPFDINAPISAGRSALLPDLSVSGHSYDPAHPKVDDRVTFRATIANLGKGTTVPVSVVADVSGPEGFQPFSKSFRLPPLGDTPGTSSNDIHFPFIATNMGIVRIRLRLDSGNEQAEQDEGNNEREYFKGIDPRPLPDLVVCLPTLQRVQAGVDELDLRMRVQNIGSARSVPCRLRIWLEDVQGDNVKWRNVPELDPGQAVEFAAECVWLTGGSKEVHAFVDAGGAVAEADEGNNKVNISVNVYLPGEPQNWEGTIEWKCSGKH